MTETARGGTLQPGEAPEFGRGALFKTFIIDTKSHPDIFPPQKHEFGSAEMQFHEMFHGVEVLKEWFGDASCQKIANTQNQVTTLCTVNGRSKEKQLDADTLKDVDSLPARLRAIATDFRGLAQQLFDREQPRMEKAVDRIVERHGQDRENLVRELGNEFGRGYQGLDKELPEDPKKAPDAAKLKAFYLEHKTPEWERGKEYQDEGFQRTANRYDEIARQIEEQMKARAPAMTP